MAETEAIVGIYGSVDRAVQADPLARLRVAQLLPQYRDPKLQWYDDFQAWLADTAEPQSVEPAFPDLVGALTELAETPAQARTHARRMFAIALATRAFPRMRSRESELRPLAIAALRTPTEGETADEPGQPAEDLYDLLAGEDQPGRLEATTGVVPAGQMAEMARRLADARHVVLPGGHLVHRDAADSYRAAVTEWLTGLTRVTRRRR